MWHIHRDKVVIGRYPKVLEHPVGNRVESKRIRVYQAVGPLDAFLVRDYLVAAGLVVEVRGQGLSGLGGALPFSVTLPSLWVVDRHEARAAALIDEWMNAQQPVGEPWMCGCGAEVDGHFGECWSCGTERPRDGG